jgi:hypothetical protein
VHKQSILEELSRRENEKYFHRRQLFGIPDTDSETDSFDGDRIEVEFELTVLRTMASYAAADCHFWQDAHRRMALVIARIRRAGERERGERAQDHQSINGEKLFRSSSSAECTEVEYATDLYSESPPSVGTKTDKGGSAPRKQPVPKSYRK